MKVFLVVVVLLVSGCASSQKISDACNYRVDSSLETEEIFSEEGLVNLYVRVTGSAPPPNYNVFDLARESLTEEGSIDVFQVMHNLNYDSMILEGATDKAAAMTAKLAGTSFRSNAWANGYDKSVCRLQKALTNPNALQS